MREAVNWSATCKSPKNDGTQLHSQRQNDFIIVIARHEVPGAISSEERFASGFGEFEAWDGREWKRIAEGTTIGHEKLDRFPKVTVRKVRLLVVQSRKPPLIRTLGCIMRRTR